MKKEFWIIIFLGVIIVLLAGLAFLPSEWVKKALPQLGGGDVKVVSVKSGQEINSPLTVEGEAVGTWFFEASFPIKVTDEQGNVLGTSYVQAESDWMTEEMVPFKGEISFSSNADQKGFLVLMKDNPSGLPENDKEIKIPIMLKKSDEITVKVFFGNSNLDPQVSCTKVFAIERQIPKIEAVGSAAVWELLKGLTEEEKAQGYFTSLNENIKLQSLEINEGTAYADFNEQLEFQVGGSCRTAAIVSQISETLKQFPTVDKVIISINGRTEDILQP